MSNIYGVNYFLIPKNVSFYESRLKYDKKEIEYYCLEFLSPVNKSISEKLIYNIFGIGNTGLYNILKDINILLRISKSVLKKILFTINVNYRLIKTSFINIKNVNLIDIVCFISNKDFFEQFSSRLSIICSREKYLDCVITISKRLNNIVNNRISLNEVLNNK